MKRGEVASALTALTSAAGLARKSTAYFSTVYAGFSASASFLPLGFLALGAYMYKKYNHQFLYFF